MNGNADPTTTDGPPPIEPRLDWIGNRRFRKAALAAAGLLLLLAGARTWTVLARRAAPQETSLYGQWSLTPGATAPYRVFVRDARDGGPVAGAEVDARLVSAAGEAVWRARTKTDEEGFALAEASLAGDLAEGAYTLAVRTASDRGENELTREVTVERSFRVLVTTDKPLYQPGQTIHVRALALATADLRPVAEEDVVIEVRDANANKVFKKRLAASEYGLASADFQLADQVTTGDYTVSAVVGDTVSVGGTVSVGDTVSERVVSVERYRLPKFRVDVATDAAYFAPGDVVRGVVSARYTFGEPVAGGEVAVVVSELVERFRAFATLEGRTDEEGRFPFELALKDHFVGLPLEQGDALISFEVTVTDRASHAQTRTLQRTVAGRPIRVDVVPESGSLVPGLPNLVYVVTSYPDGSPARTTLEIEPYGVRAATDDAGLAAVELVPRTGELTVVAEDDKGVRVEARRDLELEAQAEPVLLRTDRAVYRAGETAKVTVLSGSPSGRLFLDVVKDRRTVLTKALDVRGGRAELALDLPADLFGTLEIHAYRVLADGNLTRDTRLVQVLRASDLEIRAELDRPAYRPGELAVVDFFVTRDGGEGVPAALSLSGVDEAVFALQEMRPGLERVYFALLEELLEPRYEIHGHLPAPGEVLTSGRDQPAGGATAVAFAAARGGAGPETARVASYGQRQAAIRRERDDHLRGLLGAASLVPTLLAGLLVVPILLYGLRRLGRPAADLAEPSPPEMRRRIRSLEVRWSLALTVPILAGFGAVLLEVYFDLYFVGPWLLFVCGLAILACLVLLAFSVRRIRTDERFGRLPLLRGFARPLPFAYGLGLAGVPVLVMAADLSPRILDGRLAAGSLAAMVGLWLAASGALAVVGRGLFEGLSARRGAWIFARRLARDFLPVGAVGFLFMTGGVARMQAPMEDVAFAIPEPEFMAVQVPAEARRELARDDAEPGGGGPAAPARVRRYFPETLLWRPELVTGEDGHARLELPLADSITTWRLAASAVSRDGELGSEELGLTVFQDFFVDLDLPVALTQNDEVSVPVAVYNYLDRSQTVRLELREDAWYALAGAGTKTLDLGPGEVSSVSFRLVARKPGSHALLVEAQGGAMADAVEREVRVEPDGEPFVETLNGRLDADVEQEVFIPEFALDGASDLILKIYPGAFSQVMEGLDGIFQMPSGCFEQTSSTTYPNVLVLDYLREQGEIRPEVELKALEYINLGYQRLLTFEVPGGGFEWFGQAPAHTVLTAYGLLEFSDMSRVYDVDPAVIDRTRRWLYSKQQGDGSWEPTGGGIAEGAINAFQGQVLRTTAYVAWAMAGSGEKDARLERALDFIAAGAGDVDDPYTLALAANALSAGERPAGRLLERLDGMKQGEGELTWWTSAGEGVTFSAGDTLAIETTALAAHAFQEDGYRIDTAHRALAWLIDKKAPNGTWYSTQATVHAMRALLRGTGESGGVGDAIDVTVAVGGEPADELTITRDDADVHRLISLREHVGKGWNKVSIGVAGAGNLAYQIVATHYVPWSESRRTEVAGALSAEAPSAKALSIDLDYDTVDLETDDVLTCRVRVSYQSPGAVSMAIVDLGIPPGFELMPEAFEEMLAAERIERYSVTARQVILYFREIESGPPVEFEYRLRAKFPLEVKTPQSAVYPYYEPSVRDETEPVVLRVR